LCAGVAAIRQWQAVKVVSGFDDYTLRRRNSALESSGAARPAAQNLRVMLAIAVNETARVCSLKELVGRTSIKGTMRSTIWLGILIGSTLGRPDPVALGRWDFYLFFGFAQRCGRFWGAVGGIQNLRLKANYVKANYASVCSPLPISSKSSHEISREVDD
jgi:hypothetical protein